MERRKTDLIGDPTPTSAQRARGLELNVAAFRAPRTRVFSTDTNCFNGDGSPNNNCPMIGTLGRNTFRGRNQKYWDANLFKNFPIRSISEAFNVQVRISAYNIMNYVNRGTPNGNINDTDFANSNPSIGLFGRDGAEQRRRQMEFALKIIF